MTPAEPGRSTHRPGSVVRAGTPTLSRMPIDIHTTTQCRAPRDVAFAYVADYRNVGEWLFGISKFEPVGEQSYGLGSVFDASVHLGVHIHTRIAVDDFVEHELISFDSVKGFKVKSLWRFTAESPETTLITADISYTLPFGPAGKAMGKIMEPFVKTAVTHSSEALARHVEQAARA